MKKVYLIGNAHIDPVWLWRKSSGLSEIKSTFRSALDRMKEFQDYVFTSACASYYQWVELIDIDMFNEIKERVKEGRWRIAGGFWVQPDCNIPSGESFARHALYSQRYFFEKFGVVADIGYNVDSFGHNGMMPQILVKSGMKAYVYGRPNPYDEKPDLQENLFSWESPDGSRVTAIRLLDGYATTDWNDSHQGTKTSLCRWRAEIYRGYSERDNIPYTFLYGVGNHGGGPTIRDLKELTELCAECDDVVFSSVSDYFRDITDLGICEKLRVVKEDLQHHASGCYSAIASIKATNRRTENALVAAEKFDFLAAFLLGAKSQKERLKPAWEKVMFNQFHDILAGCSVKDACTDALVEYASAADTAKELTDLAIQKISWKIKTTNMLDNNPPQKNGWILWEKSGEGSPVVLFNPHSFPVSCAMKTSSLVSCVRNEAGEHVPMQTIRGQQTNGADCFVSLFQAEIPAFGYATYYVYRDPEFECVSEQTLAVAEDFLENNLIRVAFDRHSGYITSFYDKEFNRELAGQPMAKPVVIDDHDSDTWAHAIFKFEKEIGVFTDAEISVTERGPVRVGIRVKSRFGHSVFTQDFYLRPNSKELEVSCKLDFHEKLKIVKLSFPVDINDPEAAYSMPYGFICKKTDGCEEPSHEWMGVFDKNKGFGLALINDSKYSFSVNSADMRMIIARSACYADHFGARDIFVEYQDQGEQYFEYILTPYNQNNVSEIVKTAAVLNQKPILVAETHHDGPLTASYSGISVSCENIIVQVLKFAEEQPSEAYGDVIIRVVETAGRKTETNISLEMLNREIAVSLNPQEVKTIRINEDSIVETLLTEM